MNDEINTNDQANPVGQVTVGDIANKVIAVSNESKVQNAVGQVVTPDNAVTSDVSTQSITIGVDEFKQLIGKVDKLESMLAGTKTNDESVPKVTENNQGENVEKVLDKTQSNVTIKVGNESNDELTKKIETIQLTQIQQQFNIPTNDFNVVLDVAKVAGIDIIKDPSSVNIIYSEIKKSMNQMGHKTVSWDGDLETVDANQKLLQEADKHINDLMSNLPTF